MEAVWAMVPNLRAAPRRRTSAVNAGKFFVAMNRILPHLCRPRPIEQRTHQPLSIHFMGMLDGTHFCETQCRLASRLIPIDLAPE